MVTLVRRLCVSCVLHGSSKVLHSILRVIAFNVLAEAEADAGDRGYLPLAYLAINVLDNRLTSS